MNKNIAISGYIGNLEVIAYPYSEIPYYIVPNDGFTTNVNISIKKGTYVGTVEFLEYKR